jgi:DNA-binding MarR family transcriptional regulator
MALQYESIGSLLANVSRLMLRAFERRLQGCSLTHAQARTLVKISRHEGIRQVTLSELMEIQPITLVHVIDQLVEEKLV